MGRQTKVHREGENLIAGPAAVLHDRAAPHANSVSVEGLEQLDIEFDPRWLNLPLSFFNHERVRCWTGGAVGGACRALISEWRGQDSSEATLAELTRSFVFQAMVTAKPKRPGWTDEAQRTAEQSRGPVDTRRLAARLGLHPAWLTQAYRKAMGEGIQETAQRNRVECAVRLLRETDETCANIAAESGFCDQSHMVRAFTALLDRSPSAIRQEARTFPS
jgi:AraC-like DNA-binding protein